MRGSRKSNSSSVDAPGISDMSYPSMQQSSFRPPIAATLSASTTSASFFEPQANQFAERDDNDALRDSRGSRANDDDDDDDVSDDDTVQYMPSDIASQDDEEWRLSEASDPESDEPEPPAVHARTPTNPLMHNPSHNSSPSSSNTRIGHTHRAAFALDTSGHEGWRQLAHKRRQQNTGAAANHKDEGGHEVEEEELNKLMSRMRQTDCANDRNALSPSVIAAHEDFAEELMRSSGFKKHQKARKRMRRTMPEQALSPEVKGLIRDANILYVEERIEESVAKLQEIIRIEPTVRSAWASLALCMAELGFKEKELQAKMIEATLTPRATDMWIGLAQQSSDCDLTQQAIYCFDQAIKTSREKDKSDVLDAMWDRACLLRDIGESRASKAFAQLLKLQPHSAEVLGELVPLLLARGQTLQAIKALEQCRDFNITAFPDPTVPHGMRFATYRHSEVVTLADLLLLNREPMAALHAIRQGARWLQGRAHEVFWDEVLEDDREFDEARDGDLRAGTGAGDYGRRVAMAPVYEPLDVQMRLRLGYARARIGDMHEAHHHFDIYLSYTQPADHSEQYEELATVEMDHDQHRRALDILERMAQEDFLRVPALYAQIGACHQRLGQLAEAARCYEPVLEAEPDNLEVKLRLAEVYEDMERRPEAMHLVNEVMQARQEQARARGERGDPLGLDDQPTSVRRVAESLKWMDGQQSATSSRKKRGALDAKQKQRLESAREEETRLMFQRLQAREKTIFFDGWWRSDVVFPDDAEARHHGTHSRASSIQSDLTVWLDAASRLIDSFLGIAQLFPRRRGGASKRKNTQNDGTWSRRQRIHEPSDTLGNRAAGLLSRITDVMFNEEEDNAGQGSTSDSAAQVWRDTTSFRGVKFDEWLDLFMRYALVQTKMGQYSSAVSALNEFRTSYAVVHHPSQMTAIALCAASCALHARDYEGLFTSLRILPHVWQFNNMPLRILASAAHSCGFYGLDSFADARISKMILRRARIQQAIASGTSYEYSTTQNRYVLRGQIVSAGAGGALESDEDEEQPESSATGNPSLSRNIRNEGSQTPSIRSHSPQASQAVGSEQPPARINPLGELFYSYFLLAAGSYQAALAYSLRANARQPDDALTCLVAAVASFGRMTNRQTDNRHHLFLQGLSFLTRYRDLRKADGYVGEAAFNFARGLHSLGLLPMAILEYENVLDAHDKTSGKVTGSCHLEAAWNLALISGINGDTANARRLMGSYLMVE